MVLQNSQFVAMGFVRMKTLRNQVTHMHEACSFPRRDYGAMDNRHCETPLRRRGNLEYSSADEIASVASLLRNDIVTQSRRRESGEFFSNRNFVPRPYEAGVSFAWATLILIAFFLLFPANFASAQNSGPGEQEKILSATESFFVQLKNKNYSAVWSGLSAKSRAKIVSDVRKENKKAGVESNDEALVNDFAAGGTIAKAYWDGFLFVFNPDLALQDCKWEMGKIGSKEAEVVLQYKKSEKPAVLKLFKEDNAWKFGLDESFGARGLSPF